MDYHLHVRVLEAKGLPKVDTFGTIDPYVVLQTNSGEKFKTKYKRNDMEPSWNEDFMFRIRGNGEVLRVTLYDYNDIASNKRISEARINVNSLKPSEVLDTWYQLTPVSDYKKGGQVHLMLHLATPSDKKFEGPRVGGAHSQHAPPQNTYPQPMMQQNPYPQPMVQQNAYPQPMMQQNPYPQPVMPQNPYPQPVMPQVYPQPQAYPPAAYPHSAYPPVSPYHQQQQYPPAYPSAHGHPPPPQYPPPPAPQQQYTPNGYPGTYRI